VCHRSDNSHYAALMVKYFTRHGKGLSTDPHHLSKTGIISSDHTRLTYSMMTCHSYKHEDYKDSNAIPFVPDGADPYISHGSVGVVDKVKEKFGNSEYVRKIIFLYDMNQKDQNNAIGEIKKEVEIINRAQHSHVIRVIMTYFYIDRFVIVMDRADRNLQDYLAANARPRKEVLRWFGCLMSAVTYIHKIDIAHKDIKPTNILIKNENVLLSDFGISTIPTTVPDWSHAQVGGYRAPEVEKEATYGLPADIFSLGAVFLEMLIVHSNAKELKQFDRKLRPGGSKSYAGNLDVVRRLTTDMQRLQNSPWCSTVLSLCNDMLQENWEKRPTAKDAMARLTSSDGSPGLCTCT
jgi:serine/threonine protein kinase